MIPISKPLIGEDEIRAVESCLRSGMLVSGPNVRCFEDALSLYTGTRFGVATSSGTTALQVALEALGIGPGDEVITTPFTFIATSNAILFRGAKPVFADIDPKSYNIDPDSVKEKITERTKAVLPVHLYGNPCDMDRLSAICAKSKLILIEDCAQAVGAEWKGRRVGGFGDAAAFSFYATKNLSTGEGGMVLTNREDVREKAFLLANQGQKTRYEHVSVGYNYRLTDMQAAIGMVQLSRLDEMNKKRIGNAKFFGEQLKGLDFAELPAVQKSTKHVFNQYTLRVGDGKRDSLLKHLEKKGVGARIYYPKVSYLQPAYAHLGVRQGECVEAELAAQEVLSIPVHPSLSDYELNQIVSAVKSFGK
jgi:dTDP-4-amino-4,6-dideoxygalactose transaminase